MNQLANLSAENGRTYILNFKTITINDKKVITSFTMPHNYINCDFAFANMFSWQFLYGSEFTVINDFLVIRFYIENNGHKHLAYMFPVGNGNLADIINILEKDAEANGHPLLMLGVTPEAKAQLESALPNDFIYIPERNFFDYVYLRDDLQSLTGKKFQPKRNHINKFKKEYNYTYLPITPDIVPQCMELESKWVMSKGIDENKALINERRSMTNAMTNFDKLGLLGGAIVVDNEIIAFTYGSPINHQTFGVHVEKADTNYDGIFSVINQEFALHIPSQYIYVNREEDLGIPGLRRSKLSYNPIILLEKNSAVKRR